MACYAPIRAYMHIARKTEKGKKLVVFKTSHIQGPFDEIEVPCGKCIGCRIDKSRDWAIRCVQEASLFEKNCFITLTYNPENVDNNNSLNRRDFMLFMKRLRRHYHGHDIVETEKGVSRPIRYFQCGEYGTELGRPHHHACLFNFDFTDKEIFQTRNGVDLYRSRQLDRLWSKEIQDADAGNYKASNNFSKGNKRYTKLGYCTVGEVTWESAAYCARYICKKITGDQADDHYRTVDPDTGEISTKLPEYCTMSRKPGLGARFFERFESDFFPKDFTTRAGKRFAVPDYYTRLLERKNPEAYNEIKARRKEKALLHADDNTLARLRVRQACKERKVKRLERTYENGTTDV